MNGILPPGRSGLSARRPQAFSGRMCPLAASARNRPLFQKVPVRPCRSAKGAGCPSQDSLCHILTISGARARPELGPPHHHDQHPDVTVTTKHGRAGSTSVGPVQDTKTLPIPSATKKVAFGLQNGPMKPPPAAHRTGHCRETICFPAASPRFGPVGQGCSRAPCCCLSVRSMNPFIRTRARLH